MNPHQGSYNIQKLDLSSKSDISKTAWINPCHQKDKITSQSWKTSTKLILFKPTVSFFVLVSLSQLLIVFIIFCKYGFANHIILLLAHLTQLTFSLAHVTSFFELLVLKKLNDVYPIANSIIHQTIHRIFHQINYRIIHRIITKSLTESFIRSFIELFIESFNVSNNASVQLRNHSTNRLLTHMSIPRLNHDAM